MFLSLHIRVAPDENTKQINIPNHLSILYFTSYSAKYPEQGCEIHFLNGNIMHVVETEEIILSMIGEVSHDMAREKSSP